MCNCKACQAPIRFAQHPKTGKSMPVDKEPSTNGNLVLFHEQNILKYRAARLPADQLRPRHKSHFATCPKAGQFRK